MYILKTVNVVLLITFVLFVDTKSFPNGELTVEIKEPKFENVDYESAETNYEDQVQLKELNKEEHESSDGKVSYTGSQLWKVKTDDDVETKKVLVELRDNDGTDFIGFFI